MENYRSNSHKAKAEAKEAAEKKVDKVVTGNVKRKKKSEVSKFKDVFISEDVSNVKSYIFLDVLVPAIKKAVSDIVKDGIDMMLYGDKRSGSRGSSSYVSYRSYSDNTSRILRKRNIALAAAYTAVDKSFKEYRGRVVERFGKELDKELRYNIKAKEVEETVTDEKGNEKTVKKTVDVVDPNAISEYARFFDDGCVGWTKDPELNLIFLRQQEAAATKRLEDCGYLFLNEVYDMLGIPRTRAGQIVGWIYDKKNPIGDNYVDFGIYDTNKEANRNFVNGYERTILLDFNVEGNILELM